jgi:type IV secretion system protein VirD4
VNQGSDRGDLIVVGVLAVAAVLSITVWLTGELAGLLGRGQWPAVSPGAGATVLARLPATFGNPAMAWPVSARDQLPVARWWFLAAGAIALVVVGAFGLVVVRVARWAAGPEASPRRGPHPAKAPHPSRSRRPMGAVPAGARWATGRDVRSLRRPPRLAGGDRIVLGRVGRTLVATESRHSVLVLGPTQSGKTTALAIPAVLEWDGPVVATSVKDDLVAHTYRYRKTLGQTWVYDPTAAVRAAPRSRWSPLAEASTWGGAQRVAQALVAATPAQSGLNDSALWYQSAAKLLAPLLLGASRGGQPMADVVRWTNLQATEEVQLLLELAGETEALAALEAGRSRDERIRSSIYTTLETVLAPYEDPVVAASADGCDIDPIALLEGRNTLYLCGPAHEQARVQGVFSALVAAVVHAAVDRYERHGPLDPPLLVVLDEAANIAPLRDLDTLASTAAGMGIQLVTICQDLAQLAARYGTDRSRTIANNHRAKVALSGIADIGTLDTLSALAGEAAVREQTVTADLRDGRRSTSMSVAYRRLAPVDELRRIKPGEGILIYGHLPPARLGLRPWYRCRELRRRVELTRAEPVRATAGEPNTGCA